MTQDTKKVRELINEIFLFGDGSFDQFYTNDLFLVLQASDEGYAIGKPLITDEQYDALFQYVSVTDPGNNYFYGVGSEVRGGKVKLPYTMGSLTQAYSGGDLTKWITDNKLENEKVAVTEKLDGISALIVYGQNGKMQIAYSRGDGVEGADITRHVSKIRQVPKQVNGAMDVRAEILFSKKTWESIKTKIKRSGGAFYKNARNATAGLMNASESDPIAYDNLSVVAYEILGQDLDKSEQLNKLAANGFSVPDTDIVNGLYVTDTKMTNLLNRMRTNSRFEIDGIVIDINDSADRAFLLRNKDSSSLNPDFARKYKVADASNMAIATVIEVQWNISKNGYLKPRVKIQPVELVGVTVQHATGFNAKFIKENGIGPGAKIQITRSGDVIPFIVGVVSPTTNATYFQNSLDEAAGDLGWTWSEKKVDAIVVDASGNETVQLEQLIDFFSKVGTEYLGEGNLKTIFDAGFTTIVDVINLSEFEWTSMIGANGKKIFKSLREKLKNVPWYIVAGAHPAFGRGIGVRKMKKLYEAFAGDIGKLNNINTILAVDGFEFKTATKIVAGFLPFLKFLTDTNATITFASYEAPKGGDFAGKTFLFTGFRDKALEKTIEEKGGKISSSVSSKLTYLVAADVNETSGKLTKARENNVTIISKDDLLEMLK